MPTKEGTNSKSYEKYLKRAPEDEDMSFKLWLRNYNDAKQNPVPYKSGNTLVGAKMRSVFTDEYFYQDLVLNYPHRTSQKLLYPNYSEIPQQIRCFAAPLFFRPEMWRDETVIQNHFNVQGHKEHYIATVLDYVRSKTHFIYGNVK